MLKLRKNLIMVMMKTLINNFLNSCFCSAFQSYNHRLLTFFLSLINTDPLCYIKRWKNEGNANLCSQFQHSREKQSDHFLVFFFPNNCYLYISRVSQSKQREENKYKCPGKNLNHRALQRIQSPKSQKLLNQYLNFKK